MELESILEGVEKLLVSDKNISSNKNLNILMSNIKHIIGDMKSPIKMQNNDNLSIVISGETSLLQPGALSSINYTDLDARIEIKLDSTSHIVYMNSFTLDGLTRENTVGVRKIDDIYKFGVKKDLIIERNIYHNTFNNLDKQMNIYNSVNTEAYDELGIQYFNEVKTYESKMDNVVDFSKALTRYYVVNKDDNMDYHLRLKRKNFWDLYAYYKGNEHVFPDGTGEYMINGEHGFGNLLVGVIVTSIDDEEKEKLIKLGIEKTEDEQIRNKFIEEYNKLLEMNENINSKKI